VAVHLTVELRKNAARQDSPLFNVPESRRRDENPSTCCAELGRRRRLPVIEFLGLTGDYLPTSAGPADFRRPQADDSRDRLLLNARQVVVECEARDGGRGR
jgi:hypothetical protein